MGRRRKLGEIGGCAIYHTEYTYKRGYFTMEDGNGKTIRHEEYPAGIFWAMIKALGGIE